MRIRTAVTAACALSCMTTVSLAQTSVDRSFKSTSRDCSGVQWSEQALRTYPTIASACQGVEQRNGKTFVKFSGTVQRNADRGKHLTVDFKDGGMLTLTPPGETRLYVNGKRTAVADLRRGDALNFYIAEDRLAAHFPESDTPSTQYVIVPIVVRDQPASSSNEQLAATLPSTASPLPLLALCGFLSMGLGAALTVRRKR